MEKIKLEVIGLSYSQTQAGAYALILSVEGSDERIPIIIGGFEAQSIAIQLENLKPPRPLTHDLFVSLAKEFQINLVEVFIYKFEEGIFYSKIYFEKDDKIIEIDSRTSDAVAIALRFGSPIYTSLSIVEKTGIVLNLSEEKMPKEKNFSKSIIHEDSDDDEENIYYKYSINELKHMLKEAINNEDYEKASLIRDELNFRDSKK